jgi:hypothetical protein
MFPMTPSRAHRTLAGLAAALATAGLVFTGVGAASASTTHTVGPSGANFTTISAALADSAVIAGDTISVAASTYVEDVAVNKAVTIIAANPDPSLTVVRGKITVTAAADIEGFTLTSSDTSDPYTSADALWISAGGQGATIKSNIVTHSLHGVYADNVAGSSSAVTNILNNTFTDVGSGNTGAVWIAASGFFLVQGNTFTNPSSLADTVAVNLVGGAHDITINSNTITGFGNAIVDIAIGPGLETPSTNVVITNNSITNINGSALYFGGNNITNVTIASNTITTMQGTNSGIVFAAGYTGNPTAWINPNGPDLSGIVIQGNTIGPAAYGLNVRSGVLLASDTSIVSKGNTFKGITTNSIVGAQAGPCVTTKDDNFNGSVYILNVCAANTPALAATGAVESATPMIVATVFGLLGIIAVTFVTYRRRRA